MAQENDIIKAMLEGYKKTNIRDLNLQAEEDLTKKITMILEGAQDKHNIINPIGYDAVQLQYLRKLVSAPIIEKRVRTIKKDYFKTVAYLDFFTKFVMDTENILDEIVERTHKLEQIDPFLDPDLELCVRCASIDYVAHYRPIARNDRRKNNYNETNTESFAKYAKIRMLNPITEAAGKIFFEQLVHEEIKQQIPVISSINDLSALLFIDTNMTFYRQNENGGAPNDQEIIDLMNNKEYLKAAHSSMELAAKKLSREPLSRYISTMQPTTYD